MSPAIKTIRSLILGPIVIPLYLLSIVIIFFPMKMFFILYKSHGGEIPVWFEKFERLFV